MLVPPTGGVSGLSSVADQIRYRAGPHAQPRAPTAAPAQRADVSEAGIGDTRTYTLKVLLAEAFGCEFGSTSVRQGSGQRSIDDLQKGQTFSTTTRSGLRASISVVNVTAEHISLTAELDGQAAQVSATRVTATSIRIEFVNAREQDPLILDLSGDGIHLRPLEDGVSFDIDGDGHNEITGFVQGDDALLVWDRDGDGTLTGSDLFGDHHGARNGFEELRLLDTNQDGWINASDPVFPELRAYQDVNGDGIVQVRELRGLDEVGVKGLRLDYTGSDKLSGGQRLSEVGIFTRKDGSVGLIADALLQYREIASQEQ